MNYMEKSVVSSFDVDHKTLKPGVYLRSEYKIYGSISVKSWDLRFRAPMEKNPLDPGVVHTIEHLMAYYLRLDHMYGDKIIAFCPMGCLTGFYLLTTNDISEEEVKRLLYRTICEFMPIDTKDDIVGLNEDQCGNPDLYSIVDTNDALFDFLDVLV